MSGLLFSKRWSAREGRGLALGGILLVALVAFEMFNFDTTRYALLNLLGGLRFAGLEWAAILAIAFCGIDFAGLVRLFTPEQGLDEPKEVWLLTGAWLLGATMNAVMTWYAVSVAISGRALGTALVSTEMMVRYAPVFVATLVWLTRILFIGSISVAGERMLYGPAGGNRLPRRAPLRAPVSGVTNGHRRYERAGVATDDILGGEL